MKVLENSGINQEVRKRKDTVLDEAKRLKDESINFQDSDDLTSLSHLNEETVLQAIEARYHEGIFYSWAGVPLVAVNPFQNVAALYDKNTVEKYKRDSSVEIKELPPHIFAVGQKAFCDVKRDLETRNQSIIVSGESGAGKTWTTRSLMHFITDMTDTRSEEATHVRRIEQRILDSNPILEAFGNATTVRNENSSRFGKYIQLQFDREHKIVGATINTYLLEKTRVVHQAEGEKKFDIFDQVTSAGLQEDTQSNNYYSPAALEVTKQAMRNIGIDNQLQSEIFEVLNGILELCEVQFASPSQTHGETCTFRHFDKVLKACEMLGTDPDVLKQCLALRRITTGSTGEQFMKPCSASECGERRDCMAKLIYSSLFDWIVDFINASIRAPADSAYSFIGILDIYGFENFEVNSLEQLCINYANEKLQQHFVYHFMKRQQEDYRKEGIDWSFQEFVDNRPCLDLIEGKTSVFSLMNEECRLKRDLDTKSFSIRLETSLVENSHFTRPRFRTKDHEFTIHHFADSVCYKVEGLVKKNKDLVPPEVVELLKTSKNPLVQKLFPVRTNEAGNGVKGENGECSAKDAGKHRQATVTVVYKFKASLDSLMSTLRSTNVHYIRCIKPNSECRPGIFNSKQVLAQLNACGVVETIRISAAGFPIRLSHHEFLKRYSLVHRHLAPATNKHVTDSVQASSPFKSPASPRVSAVDRRKRRSRRAKRSCYDHTRFICRSILEVVQCNGGEEKENASSKECEGVKVGRTKIFFQVKEMEKLELVRNKCLTESVLTIQKCWRRHRKQVERKRTSAAITIQSVWRGWFAKKSFQKVREAVKVIQRYTRLHFTIKQQKERHLIKTDHQLESIEEVPPRMNSPVLRPSQCKSVAESTKNALLESSALRPYGSYSNPFEARGKEFSLNTCFSAHYAKQTTFKQARRNATSTDFLSMLASFSTRYSERTDTMDKRNVVVQSVNRSSNIASRREIEKVPVAFHCNTPLPYANTRPRQDCTSYTGLAGICEMDCDTLQSEELD